MKQSLSILLCLLFLFSFIKEAKSYDPPLVIYPLSLKFDYATGYSNDALNIRKNYSTDIPVPEWDNGGTTNAPMAYIKNQSNRKIQVRFYCNYSFEKTVRGFTYSPSQEPIGYIYFEGFTYSGYISPYITLIAQGSIPQDVGIRDFMWHWQLYVKPSGPYGEVCSISYTNHTYYTLLDAPQNPMSEPWTDVLDYACDWASGQSNASGAAGAIVQGLFDWGLRYDIYNGAPHFPEGAGYGNSNFYLTAFLQAKGTSSLCNCYDMGKAVKTFCNAIGCSTSYRYSSPFGYLNCIIPIGRDWTNNPFYPNLSSPYNVPIVGEDLAYPYRTQFVNHAFGSIDDDIYDACLKVDTDSNPDAPPHSNNGNGDWVTGWIWDDYKGKVVDNNPATSTGYPTSNYNSWSVY